MGFGEGYRCFTCQKGFPFEEFKHAEKEETFAVCAHCGEEMPLTPFRQGFLGYICLCDNCVAVPFQNELVLPQDILRLQWNEAIEARGVRLTDTCSVAVCETAKDSADPYHASGSRKGA